jgi:outer membrane protein TolC
VKRSLFLSLLAALALAAPSARAQSPAAPGAAPVHELTLDEALAMARKANRNLAVDRSRVAEAETTVEQAWSALVPTVVAQGRYTRNNIAFSFPVGTRMLTIQPLNQLDLVGSAVAPLIAPPAYAALSSVKANRDSALANYEASEAQVLFTVAQTFYSAAGADEVLRARKSSTDVARATLQNAQTRFSAGTVTKVDVDRAELAVVRAQQAERETENAREQTYRALATLIQTRQPFVVSGAQVTPPARRDESLDMALHLRPEFRALELSVKSSEEQASAYAWRWAPTLSAFGNGRVFNYDNFAFQRHAWAVGVQLDWTLYDGGTRDAQRHLAASQAQEAADRAAVLRDQISDDLANGRSQLDTKNHAREAAERSVTLAQETIDLVRTQYEAGSATQLDLLQAQDNLVAAQESLAQAHFDVAVADLALRRAAGTFPGK